MQEPYKMGLAIGCCFFFFLGFGVLVRSVTRRTLESYLCAT